MFKYQLFILTFTLSIFSYVFIGFIVGRLFAGAEFNPGFTGSRFNFGIPGFLIIGLSVFVGIAQLFFYGFLRHWQPNFKHFLKLWGQLLVLILFLYLVNFLFISEGNRLIEVSRIFIAIGTPFVIGGTVIFLFSLVGEVLFLLGVYGNSAE